VVYYQEVEVCQRITREPENLFVQGIKEEDVVLLTKSVYLAEAVGAEVDQVQRQPLPYQNTNVTLMLISSQEVEVELQYSSRNGPTTTFPMSLTHLSPTMTEPRS